MGIEAGSRQIAGTTQKSRRVRLSLLATLAGWAAATFYSLWFQTPLLWRNAPPGGLILDLAEGLGLWSVFTLAVCVGVWCVVVLPIALWVPPAMIVRRRWPITLAASLGAVMVVGLKLGTWVDLLSLGHGPVNPVTTPLFLEYAGFACTLALVTTLMYGGLLRGAIKS